VGPWYQLLGPCGRLGSVPGMLDRDSGHARYPSKTHALYWPAVTTMIIFFDM